MPSRGDKGGKPPKKTPDEFDVMKWWLESRDGVDDAQDRDMARSCTSKATYGSESEARAHIAMNKMAGALFTYRCAYCEFWHLTKRRM